MYKTLILTLPMSLTFACTMPDSSRSESELGCDGSGCPEPCETDGGCPEPEPGPTCPTRNGDVDLDQQPANLDDDDGKVTFCHATSSATNPFVVITTSVNACKAHEEHTKLPKGGEADIFPTGGCED